MYEIALTFEQSVATCSSPAASSEFRGYESLEQVQQDINLEVEKIRNGTKEPKDEYLFPFCPFVTFEVGNVPLIPKLPNSTFQCSTGYTLAEICKIKDGHDQVVLEDVRGVDYTLHNIRFEGFTFLRFDHSAINGEKLTSTNVEIVDCIFEDFESEYFIIQEHLPHGGESFSLNVTNSKIMEGEAYHAAFTTTKGDLHISGLEVDRSRFPQLVSFTGPGNSTLTDIKITNSAMETIFSYSEGANLNASGISVRVMGNLSGGLRCEGGE